MKRKIALLTIGFLLLATAAYAAAVFNMNKGSAKFGNTVATAINTALDGGSLQIYDTAIAGASAANPTGANILATLTLPAASSNTIAAAQTSGVTLTFAHIDSVTVTNPGTAASFRLLTSGGVCVFEGNVGTSASGLNFSGGVVFTAGGTVAITDYVVITVPGT